MKELAEYLATLHSSKESVDGLTLGDCKSIDTLKCITNLQEPDGTTGGSPWPSSWIKKSASELKRGDVIYIPLYLGNMSAGRFIAVRDIKTPKDKYRMVTKRNKHHHTKLGIKDLEILGREVLIDKMFGIVRIFKKKSSKVIVFNGVKSARTHMLGQKL